MSPERQEALARFVLDKWLQRPRAMRNWSLVALGLLVAVAALLVAVKLSGAQGTEDIHVPAIVAGGLALVTGWTHLHARRRIASLQRHELISALRASPPAIAAVEPLTIQGPYGPWRALSFRVKDGGIYPVFMDEPTRAEFLSWLGRSSG